MRWSLLTSRELLLSHWFEGGFGVRMALILPHAKGLIGERLSFDIPRSVGISSVPKQLRYTKGSIGEILESNFFRDLEVSHWHEVSFAILMACGNACGVTYCFGLPKNPVCH